VIAPLEGSTIAFFIYKENILNNSKQINRIKKEKLNNDGCLMRIIEYNKSNNIIIEFQDEHKTQISTTYQCFKNGTIRNPYFKSIYGKGYLGQNEYKTKIKHKKTIQYSLWTSMLSRCYNKNFHKKCITYIECNVCEEWLNFQNFAKWFDENYYEITGEEIHLDKDILFKGNKIYSPETCVFVPKKINILFNKRQNKRGNYPIGVAFRKDIHIYMSYIKINNKTKNLGYYNTPEEAFQAYKTAKENHIKQVADEYKDKIPQRLYDAMYRYKVEITD